MINGQEEQFKAWWYRVTGLHTEFSKDPMETAEIAFKAGWDASKAEIKAKLLIEATGHDCW